MRRLLFFAVVLLSGCALTTPATVPATRPAQPEFAAFALNGRVAVKHNGTHRSAALRWTHAVQSDELLLLTPLGQTAARIYRDAQSATLDEGDKHYLADNVESLMQQVLGWYLPLTGLHHWVLGMPSGGSPARVELNDNGQVTALHQDGWEVNYLRHADTRPDSLPTRLQMNRTGLQIQLLIDEWELP